MEHKCIGAGCVFCLNVRDASTAAAPLTLRQVAQKAEEIYNAWEEGAEYDAAFDAGEFSGPACARAAEKEVTALAEQHGFTYDQVQGELCQMSNESQCEQNNRNE